MPSCGVRDRYGVSLVASRETVDDCAVETRPRVQDVLELVNGDGKTFYRADDVGEPKSDETYVLLVGGTKHELFGFVVR